MLGGNSKYCATDFPRTRGEEMWRAIGCRAEERDVIVSRLGRNNIQVTRVCCRGEQTWWERVYCLSLSSNMRCIDSSMPLKTHRINPSVISLLPSTGLHSTLPATSLSSLIPTWLLHATCSPRQGWPYSRNSPRSFYQPRQPATRLIAAQHPGINGNPPSAWEMAHCVTMLKL